MQYRDEHQMQFTCNICNENVGEETGFHREEKKHYEFIGKEIIKRTYITNRPN